jgi:triosephosphate isomerase
MNKPIVVINFKTYNNGLKAVSLASKIEAIDSKIIIGVQPTEVYRIDKAVKNPVYCEHVDPIEPGRNTGFISAEAVKAAGAKGVFLNHSEHRLKLGVIKDTVKHCKKIELKVGLFAKDLKQALELKKLRPDFLMIEPPELVAGKISVSKAKPGLIENISKKLKYDFLVGAGIKTNEDLKIAMKLGAKGIAISSAITTAKNPTKVLKDLIK